MKIDFLTGKRGGFGAMVPTLKALQQFADLRVIATDQHIDRRFGGTVQEIVDEGFNPLGIKLPDGQPRAAQLGWLAQTLALLWREELPDVLLLIGDRGESLAGAMAAQQLGGIVIAHIEGGDVTGCIDDSTRHAISKLAHLHFVTGIEQRARLIRMGEIGENVCVVGDVHIDRLMLELAKPVVGDERFEDATVILHHPDTLHPERIQDEIQEICEITRDSKRLFIHPCSDNGHEIILRCIEYEIGLYGGWFEKNIPHGAFINGLRQARKFVGNSSALVREASYIDGLKTVLVGDRQEGRPYGRYYGDGKAYERIASALSWIDKTSLIAKRWSGA
jgi:UDP-hydrolysing UDP-N-acetyl-D-glucosamine 2-epimerase